MSYEDYVNHIYQKHRLAISLAVIKTKPENVTIEDHIKQLRNLINRENMELDNLSICSDDFLIDETNDFDMNIEQNNDGNDRNDDLFASLYDKHDYCTQNLIEIDDTQDVDTNIDNLNTNIINNETTNNHKSKNEDDKITHQIETNDIEMIDTHNLNDSITILDNFDVGNELDGINTITRDRSSLGDVVEILKGIDNNMTTIEKAVSNTILLNFTADNLLIPLPKGIDDTQCFTDNDATQCESLYISTNVDEHMLSQNCNNLNEEIKNAKLENSSKLTKNQSAESKTGQKHARYTKSVVELKETNAVVERKEANASKVLTNNNDKCQISTDKIYTYGTSKKNSKESSDLDNIINAHNKTSNLKAYRKTKEFKNIYKNVAGIFDSKNNKKNCEDEKAKSSDETKQLDTFKDVPKNTQDILKYDITQDSTCNTHYSQSQINDLISIDHRYIHGKKRNINTHNKRSVNKKKKNVNVVIVENELNSSKKEVTKDISDIDIFSQEIQLTKVSTVKEDISQNFKNDEKSINETDRIKANETILQDSQMTNCVTPSHNSQTFNQNNEANFKNNHNNNAISKTVFVENSRSNYNNIIIPTNDSMIYAGNSMVNANNSRLNLSHRLHNAKDSMINANNYTLNDEYRRLYANDCMLNTKDIILTPIANKQDIINNVKHVENNIFSEESELTNFTYSTEAFQNYSSNDSFGFSHNLGDFGTKNYKTATETALDKNFAAFDKKCNHTLSTDKSEANFENTETVNTSNNENCKTSDKTNDKDNQKSCIGFENHNSIEIHNDRTKIAKTLDHLEVAKYNEPKNNPLTENCTNSDDNLESEENTDSEAEKIPFKIIEELNKVKTFLNRRQDKTVSSKGYSSDTGYRSDSSSRNSLKLSQPLSSVLDQSAHSLFHYISEGPLIVTTEGITEEISMVLGQLIDKLHEEEVYPSFLEGVLQSVQQTLENIYQESSDNNMLSKKDESMHRVILLNKSTHIQKYTIEKITHTLENLHTELTTNESFEIQNIDKIENICYIFNLLEIILQKYKRTSQNLSQNTQNLSQNTQNLSQNTLSQSTQEDEKPLKKSNIIDIWRKKWNPNYKENQIEGSQEKKCVLRNCNDVLNKLIVGCMEGYSLVSYYALKCFNVMQN